MMTLIKTITNSWATSCRFHEPEILPCIFGCPEERDDLAHYLRCDPLWTILATAWGASLGFLSRSPLQRLGLINPSVTSFLHMVSASRVYHAIRRDSPDVVRSAISEQDFANLHDITLELANYFACELS